MHLQNAFLDSQLKQTRMHLERAEQERRAHLVELNAALSKIDRLQSPILNPSLTVVTSEESELKPGPNGLSKAPSPRSSTSQVKVEVKDAVSAAYGLEIV